MTPKRKIFVVDDEKDIVKIVQYHLHKAGFEVIKAYSGGAALDVIQLEKNISLIILDIMLPGIDGLEICRRLKADGKTRGIPVIMLTVKSEEADIVRGLRTGADDYITKPFSPKVLVERVKAVLKRSSGPGGKNDMPEIIRVGDIEINLPKHDARIKGKSVALTALEFNILTLFASSPGKVLTREELLKNAWKEGTDTSDKAVDVHMTWLRHKIGACGDLIETVRGVGYRLKESD